MHAPDHDTTQPMERQEDRTMRARMLCASGIADSHACKHSSPKVILSVRQGLSRPTFRPRTPPQRMDPHDHIVWRGMAACEWVPGGSDPHDKGVVRPQETPRISLGDPWERTAPSDVRCVQGGGGTDGQTAKEPKETMGPGKQGKRLGRTPPRLRTACVRAPSRSYQ